MFYPNVMENGNTRDGVNYWYGINHNPFVDDGYFYDMQNLSSDNFPLLSSRKRRLTVASEETPVRGFCYTDDGLVYLVGTKLKFLTEDLEYDLSDYVPDDGSEQTLLRYGAYILIFPAGVSFNTVADAQGNHEILSLEEKYTSPSATGITYSICKKDGDVLNIEYVSSTEPDRESLNEGDLWLNQKDGGLYTWDADTKQFVPVATTYVKITINQSGLDLTKQFDVEDAVYMNSRYAVMNNGSIIQSMGANWIVVIGLIPQASVSESRNGFYIHRKVPKLDYVCVSNNRVWGCRYGKEGNEFINQIYASKLGDPRNWFSYAGNALDSYALSIGRDGAFTGCIEYQGYPTFFKEDVMFRIYGAFPAQYQLSTINCAGVQKGSERSLCVVGNYLYYKAAADVCVFDGSNPTPISKVLGRDQKYYRASGGCWGNKYYMSCEDAKGAGQVFVYDADVGQWYKEDGTGKERFTQATTDSMYSISGGDIYGYGSSGIISFIAKNNFQKAYDKYIEVSSLQIPIGSQSAEKAKQESVKAQERIVEHLRGEQIVEWYGITGDMGLAYPDHKYLSKLTFRLKLPVGSEASIAVSYDDGDWIDLIHFRPESRLNTQSFSFCPRRCNHYKIKFSGKGECMIYSMARTIDMGSEENSWN